LGMAGELGLGMAEGQRPAGRMVPSGEQAPGTGRGGPARPAWNPGTPAKGLALKRLQHRLRQLGRVVLAASGHFDDPRGDERGGPVGLLDQPKCPAGIVEGKAHRLDRLRIEDVIVLSGWQEQSLVLSPEF